MIKQIMDLVASVERDGKRLNQHLPEWAAYLEYVKGYLLLHGITKPIVVEIGILDGAQRRFYEELFGAEYIGLDIDPNAPADIRGDSGTKAVFDQLKKRLNGRMIDVLFIDGLHTYEGVKADYDLYAPLTKHIVAVHDIHTPKLVPGDTVDVIRWWRELLSKNTEDTVIIIQHHNPRPLHVFNGRPLGIGLIVKRR